MKSKRAQFPNADSCAQGARLSTATVDSSIQADVIHLHREKMIRLEKPSAIKTVEINRGVVWVTGTPAKGDILLRAGDRFELQDNWPYVIQALESADLALVQAGQRGRHPVFGFPRRPNCGIGPILILPG